MTEIVSEYQMTPGRPRDPISGEWVDECEFSATGWGIWRSAPFPGVRGSVGYCTCQPANPPSPLWPRKAN